MTDETQDIPQTEEALQQAQQATAQEPKPDTPAPADNPLRQSVEKLASQLPDHLKPLLPRYSPEQQIEWIAEALASIPASRPAVPQTDTKPALTVQPQADISTLPPAARMATRYGAN